jgi:hypothetical protein
MTDRFSQAINKPLLVNLYTSAGTGNGMGSIMTAHQNKTLLIITPIFAINPVKMQCLRLLLAF